MLTFDRDSQNIRLLFYRNWPLTGHSARVFALSDFTALTSVVGISFRFSLNDSDASTHVPVDSSPAADDASILVFLSISFYFVS